MNKIFKVIWNRTTQSLVVASELAKGQVKSSSDVSVSSVTSTANKLFKLSAIALATLGIAGQANAVTASINGISADHRNQAVAVGGASAFNVGTFAAGSGADARQMVQ